MRRERRRKPLREPWHWNGGQRILLRDLCAHPAWLGPWLKAQGLFSTGHSLIFFMAA